LKYDNIAVSKDQSLYTKTFAEIVLTDWVPETFIRFHHPKDDEMVPVENLHEVLEAFKDAKHVSSKIYEGYSHSSGDYKIIWDISKNYFMN